MTDTTRRRIHETPARASDVPDRIAAGGDVNHPERVNAESSTTASAEIPETIYPDGAPGGGRLSLCWTWPLGPKTEVVPSGCRTIRQPRRCTQTSW